MTCVLAMGHVANALANLLVAMPIAGMALFGWQNGVFLATVVGLQVLSGFVAALALVAPLAVVLEGLDCPASHACVVAYAMILGGSVLATRLAVGAAIPQGAMRFPPAYDQALGACVGLVAGIILSGALFIGWSMAAVPGWLRLDAARLRCDTGSWMLRTFVRCIEPDAGRRVGLLEGEQMTPAVGDGDDVVGITCSEPFDDGNGNRVHDDQEAFVDVDGDGRFTADMPFRDDNADGRRRIGLLECYRLANWTQATVVVTVPDEEPVPEASAGSAEPPH